MVLVLMTVFRLHCAGESNIQFSVLILCIGIAMTFSGIAGRRIVHCSNGLL